MFCLSMSDFQHLWNQLQNMSLITKKGAGKFMDVVSDAKGFKAGQG